MRALAPCQPSSVPSPAGPLRDHRPAPNFDYLAHHDQGQFAAEGGFKQMTKRFDGKLEAVLGDLADELRGDVS